MTTTITKELLEGALDGQRNPLRSVPKSDLHAHLLLSPPFEAFKKLSPGIKSPPRYFKTFSDFHDYIGTQLLPVVSSVHAQLSLMRAAFDQMVFDGVTYTEICFDIMMGPRAGVAWSELLEGAQSVLDDYKDRLTIEAEIGVRRDFTVSQWFPMMEDLLSTKFFKGIDLYGDELSRDIEEFSNYFSLARKKGLRVKLHTGETGDAARMYHEVMTVKPDAIQHGIAAIGESRLIKELVRTQIPLHICPTSNVALSIVPSYREHPIRALVDKGVKVTLNTDDFTIFGSSINDEYVRLYKEGIFDAETLEEIRKNGIPLLIK